MTQPKRIYWKPVEGLKYPALKKTESTWLIYTQSTLKLEPLEKKTIGLNFGFMQADGLILIIPTDEIKKNMEFKSPFYCERKTDNIKTILYNFAKTSIIIPECTPLCFVKFLKV